MVQPYTRPISFYQHKFANKLVRPISVGKLSMLYSFVQDRQKFSTVACVIILSN